MKSGLRPQFSPCSSLDLSSFHCAARYCFNIKYGTKISDVHTGRYETLGKRFFPSHQSKTKPHPKLLLWAKYNSWTLKSFVMGDPWVVSTDLVSQMTFGAPKLFPWMNGLYISKPWVSSEWNFRPFSQCLVSFWTGKKIHSNMHGWRLFFRPRWAIILKTWHLIK